MRILDPVIVIQMHLRTICTKRFFFISQFLSVCSLSEMFSPMTTNMNEDENRINREII